MLITGNSFIDYLFIAITFLPLIPAVLTLFSNFGKEPFTLILIICLVNFLRDIPTHLHMLTPEDQAILNNICYPIELLLFARLFRPIRTKTARYILTIILVAFLSSLLTWLAIKGFGNNSPGLETIKNGILLGVILLSLPPIVQSKGLDVFRSPLFWMAGGTLFYLLIILLLEWVSSSSPSPENSIFLSLAALVRYLLYTLAVWPHRDELPAEG
ncbi:MAG: hypothetical protein BGO55_28375 [Sphingobacteriales bacterium 50-39]|nr:hypothetical protein [Sphingobacteriales bacterium]OJW60482.1 MAG: hypothetical protein BGO55_28375 [Sphingobacteriales bacterium 50-39]